MEIYVFKSSLDIFNVLLYTTLSTLKDTLNFLSISFL